MNPRRLYRSRDRQLAGVAGGMAEYLDIDPTVVRILWIIAGLASAGFALLAYLVLALVIPQAPWAATSPVPGSWAPAGAGTATGWTAPPAAPVASAWDPQGSAGVVPATAPRPRSEGRGFGLAAIVGVVLIVFGAVALADAALPGWIAGAVLGPAVVLALGAALLVSSIRRGENGTVADPAPAPAPVASAAAWDVTDTQAVDPTAVGASDPSDDPGARPA